MSSFMRYLLASPKSKRPLSMPSKTKTDDLGIFTVISLSMSTGSLAFMPSMPPLPIIWSAKELRNVTVVLMYSGMSNTLRSVVVMACGFTSGLRRVRVTFLPFYAAQPYTLACAPSQGLPPTQWMSGSTSALRCCQFMQSASCRHRVPASPSWFFISSSNL